MRALVVDDSMAMRSVLRLILKQGGFEVLDAKDGPSALALLKEKGPTDIALFDWNMPQMTGLELLQAVRADHGCDSMRVVMVTTETELSNLQRALDSGADEYIMKPFSKDMVLDKLRLIGF